MTKEQRAKVIRLIEDEFMEACMYNVDEFTDNQLLKILTKSGWSLEDALGGK